MILILFLAILPSAANRLQNDLRLYLATAYQYASTNRAAALHEIRQWSPTELHRVTAALKEREKKLRSVVTEPDQIDFRMVEAAVLMHGEAGLLFLQEQRLPASKLHLDTAVELQQWSIRAAAEARNWANMRRYAFKGRPVDPGLEIQPSIDGRDFYVALATAALALGFPEAAAPFAEKARQHAPRDPEVQLVLGSVSTGLATERGVQHRDKDAAHARETAENAFRNALALAPAMHEARLRYGKLMLDLGRAAEAEPLLAAVEASTTNDRQRYLARLFRGRAAEGRGHSDEAIQAYRSALEAWPGSQAARFALAHALEKSSGPGAAREIVGTILERPRPADEPADPWFSYHIGPPGLATAAFKRVWDRMFAP